MDKIRAEFEEKFPPNKLLRFDDQLDCYVADHQSELIQALLKDTDIFAQNIAWCGYKAGYEAAKASQWISVDSLAEIIRRVDGKHNLGAGALAEAILAEIGPTE